jgi:hypothetical protein
MTRRLGGETHQETKRYRVTVAGRQRFHGAEPGETVELELTEKMLAVHLLSGVIAEHELLDEGAPEHEGTPVEDDGEPESHPGHGDPPVETVHGEDAAHVEVNDEAGPEPEHK